MNIGDQTDLRMLRTTQASFLNNFVLPSACNAYNKVQHSPAVGKIIATRSDAINSENKNTALYIAGHKWPEQCSGYDFPIITKAAHAHNVSSQ